MPASPPRLHALQEIIERIKLEHARPPQEPLNDKDIEWVKSRRDLDDVDNAVNGITNSEILWGGPRGEGLVYVVGRLVEATSSLAKTVTALEYNESARANRELTTAKRNRLAGRIALLVITPSTAIPFLRLIYITVQPWLAAHGVHAPTLVTGVRQNHE